MVDCIGLYVMAIVVCSCNAGTQNDRLRTRISTTKVVATVGSTAHLNCSAVANQSGVSTKVTWFKYGKPLMKVTFRTKDRIFRLGSHVLVFDEILLADAGRYICTRRTGNKIENRTFNLSVKEPREHPIIIGETQGNISTTLGQNVVFSCKIQTRTIAYIEWRFLRSSTVNTSRNISMNESFTISSTTFVSTKLKLKVIVPLLLDGASESRRTILGERRQVHEDRLYIYNVSSMDSGTYICLAFNKFGKATKETTLTISQVPGKEPSCGPKNLEANESSIPVAILIAIPAGLFFLACTVIIRALDKARKEKKLAKLAKAEKEREKEREHEQENNKDITQSKSSVTDINENRPVAMVKAQNFRPVHVISERIPASSTDAQRSDSVSTSSASQVEVLVVTDNKLAKHLSLSKQSSLPSSTEMPYTSPTPDLLSSSSCGVELDWEGMDLTIPDGIELVELSREAEV